MSRKKGGFGETEAGGSINVEGRGRNEGSLPPLGVDLFEILRGQREKEEGKDFGCVAKKKEKKGDDIWNMDVSSHLGQSNAEKPNSSVHKRKGSSEREGLIQNSEKVEGEEQMAGEKARLLV